MIEMSGVKILGVQIFITLIILAFVCKLFDSNYKISFDTKLPPILMIREP